MNAPICVALLTATILASYTEGQICDSTSLIDGTSYMAPGAARYSAYLQIFTDLKITCTGSVVQWGVVQNSNVQGQGVYLDVWRPSSDGLTYTLIGSNRISPTTSSGGVQTYPITAGQQFQVQVNDVIGMHYDSYNTTSAQSVVPYLDPENAPATTTTIVWKLQDSEIRSQGKQVVAISAVATDQQRLPGLLAYISTVSTSPSVVTPAPTQPTAAPPVTPVPPIINPATPGGSMIHISIGNFGFDWPGLATSPTLIINSASALMIASTTLLGRSFLVAAGTMLLANLPYTFAQTTAPTAITTDNFKDFKVNGTEVWKILAGVAGAVGGIIILLVILVIIAFCRRPSKLAAPAGAYAAQPQPVYKNTKHGAYVPLPEAMVQTDFNPAFATRGAKVDATTMTKRSMYTEPPPPPNPYSLHDNDPVSTTAAAPFNTSTSGGFAQQPTGYIPAGGFGDGAPQVIRMHFGPGTAVQ